MEEFIMTYNLQHPTYGHVVYEEGFWAGKRSLTINGTPLQAIDKKSFAYGSKKITLKGNILTGVILEMDGNEEQIVPKPTWYETLFTILMFSVGIIWGNFPVLCAIFPVIGGAIGGFLSAMFAMINLCITRASKNTLFKFLSCVAFFVITILVCHWVALALLTAIA